MCTRVYIVANNSMKCEFLDVFIGISLISTFQENLGNTREEVERLQSILKTMKIVVCEELNFVRKELAILRERSNKDKSGFAEMTERMRVALSLYSRECDRRLQEREQELTLEHEFEITDVKKLIQSHEEEICTLKHNLLEKETELTEHERLVATMRQKLEDEQIERGNLQTRLHQQLEDYSRILEQARIDKEEAMKKANDEKFLEITSLTNSLTQCQKRIQELEENLITARNDQERIMKEVTDKFQIEYKTELETIRSRFKLMAASTMERSPSDSSLERIEVNNQSSFYAYAIAMENKAEIYKYFDFFSGQMLSSWRITRRF